MLGVSSQQTRQDKPPSDTPIISVSHPASFFPKQMIVPEGESYSPTVRFPKPSRASTDSPTGHLPDQRTSGNMGFLQKFFNNVFHEGQMHEAQSSFENLSENQLEAHLKIASYGDFSLTDAVRPSFDLQVVPSAGYRHDVYRDRSTGVEIPVIMAAATSENMMDIFIDLIDPMGSEVDVVLETSHDREHGGHDDLYREHIDVPVLKSILYDFEEMLLNDGCTGIAVLNPKIPVELQFDEHKLLIMYGQNLQEFERILQDSGVPHSQDVQFITEAEHVHSSREEFIEQFDQLKYRLGLDDMNMNMDMY